MAVCGVRYGCMWSEVWLCQVCYTQSHWLEFIHYRQIGLTHNDILYILLGVESTTPTAFLEYTMEELTQCEVYGERG